MKTGNKPTQTSMVGHNKMSGNSMQKVIPTVVIALIFIAGAYFLLKPDSSSDLSQSTQQTSAADQRSSAGFSDDADELTKTTFDLQQAQSLFDEGRFEQALSGAQDYKDAESSLTAQLIIALSQDELGGDSSVAYGKAAILLEKDTEESGSLDYSFRIAEYYEKSGDTQKAKVNYQKVIDAAPRASNPDEQALIDQELSEFIGVARQKVDSL